MAALGVVMGLRSAGFPCMHQQPRSTLCFIPAKLKCHLCDGVLWRLKELHRFCFALWAFTAQMSGYLGGEGGGGLPCIALLLLLECSIRCSGGGGWM